MARSSTACRCSWRTRVNVASKGQSIGPVGLDKHPYRTSPLVTSRRRRVVLAAHSCRARHTCGRLLHPRVGRPRLQGLLAGAVCRRRVWTQRSGYAPPVLVDLYAPRRRADRPPPLAMAEVTFGGKWRRSGSYKMSFAIALRAAKSDVAGWLWDWPSAWRCHRSPHRRCWWLHLGRTCWPRRGCLPAGSQVLTPPTRAGRGDRGVALCLHKHCSGYPSGHHEHRALAAIWRPHHHTCYRWLEATAQRGPVPPGGGCWGWEVAPLLVRRYMIIRPWRGLPLHFQQLGLGLQRWRPDRGHHRGPLRCCSVAIWAASRRAHPVQRHQAV